MSLDKYTILLKVVECGSFTKAADLMGYTQSGISHAINSLEDEFGIKLLVRSRTGTVLTPNGERILRPIREIVHWHEQLKQTISSINGMMEGKIRIGTFTSLSSRWLPQVMKAFFKDFPNIEFEIIDGDYEQIENWILERKIDCGFVNLPEKNEKLHIIPIVKDRLIVVLYENHPLSDCEKISIEQLNGEYFILPGEGMNYDVGRIIKENNLNLKVRYHAKNDFATLGMVKNGMGISVLPELLLDSIPEGIVMRELEPSFCRHIGFATLHVNQRPPAVQIFERYIKEGV